MPFKIITSLVRTLFLGLFFLFLFFPDKFHIRIEYAGFPLSDNWFVRFAKLAFWVLISVEMMRIFYYGIIKIRKQGLVANELTVVIPVAVTLIILEIIFMYIPPSHEGILSRIVRYKEASSAKMYTVFIPFLFQLDKSTAYTKPVESFLRSRNVNVITLNSSISKFPEKERVVGENDGHASTIINRIIADNLNNTLTT